MFAVLYVLLNTSLNNTLSSHIIFIHVNTYPYIWSHPREYLPLQNSYIKSHLHLPLQNIYTYRSPIYIYIYRCKTSTHTDLKSHLPMSMRNWMLPRFLDNYRRERYSTRGNTMLDCSGSEAFAWTSPTLCIMISCDSEHLLLTVARLHCHGETCTNISVLWQK